MANLSTATEHALSVVAHALMAQGIAKNVKGMDGLYEFWLKEQTPKDRKVVASFIKLSKQATKDFSAMLVEDKEVGNG
jgi:hypothetical protein